MIATTIAVLVSVITIATVLTLVDCALRTQSAYAALRRQQALVKAGFVPQIEASMVRLRPAISSSRSAVRPYAKRLPRRFAAPELDAA